MQDTAFATHPTVRRAAQASLIAARDGRRDARKGRSAYLWSLLTDPDERRYLFESGWKGIAKVFVLAFALDVVYQFMECHRLKPLQALLTAIILAVIPYALLRSPINRLVRITWTGKTDGLTGS